MKEPLELILHDDGAFTEIEDNDVVDPVEVEDNPFLPDLVDDDGYPPGLNPARPSFQHFDEEEGLLEEVPEEDGSGREVDPGDAASFGDELDEHLHHHDEQSTVNGEYTSELGRHALVEEAEKRVVRVAAPWVRIVPETAYAALMGGNAAVFAPPSPAAKIEEVARWTGLQGADALPVSVAFSQVSAIPQTFTGENESFSADRYAPFGIVQYGTRNGPLSIEVDINVGCQFTIGATAVSLLVGLDDIGGTNLAPMDLAGQLSFFTVTHLQPITRTRYIPSLPAGPGPPFFPAPGSFNWIVPVPKFSKSVSLWRADASQSAVLQFFASDGNSEYLVDVPAGTYMLTPIPLVGSVFFVMVRGGSAIPFSNGPLAASRLLFNLAL
jgi:hypothetical protein